jgi:hypothetical protein
VRAVALSAPSVHLCACLTHRTATGYAFTCPLCSAWVHVNSGLVIGQHNDADGEWCAVSGCVATVERVALGWCAL